MSNLTVPNLTLRESKGAPLTNSEIDFNWITLRNFCNSLAQLMGVSLNTDGSLKDNSVEEGDIKNRQIGPTKLKLNALPFFQDVGSTNNFAIAPDPAITAYENNMVFIVRALTANTGPALFKVNNLEALPLKKQGNLELESGDIKAQQVFMVAYFGGGFHLISGSAAQSTSNSTIDSTGNLQGVLFSGSAATPANGATTSFTHALNALPDSWVVVLEAIGVDAGFVIGDTLPLDEITKLDGTPMFRVKVNSSYITVTRLDAGNGYYGGLELAIGTLWQIRVKAIKETSPTLNLQPAASFQIVSPNSAVTYGQYCYVAARNETDVASPSRIFRVDMQTSQVEIVGTNGTKRNVNFHIYRGALNEDRLIAVDDGGIRWTTLQKPVSGAWVIGEIYTGNTYDKYKVLAVDDAAGIAAAGVWLGPQQGAGTSKVNDYRIKKRVLGGAETSMTGINFTSATGADAAKFSAMLTTPGSTTVMFCLYNPAKKRIYMVDKATALMHIFELSVDLTGWLVASPAALDYSQLTYKKSIVIGGGVIWTATDFAYDSINIEFDLGTGEEKALVLAQDCEGTALSNNNHSAGIVTRIPWRE